MRYRFITTHRGEYAVSRLCEALAVSRSGYYSWCHCPPSARVQGDPQVLALMQRLHQQTRERYGAVKLWHALQASGISCGRHRVARLRRAYGLEARRTRRFRLTGEHHHLSPPAPNHLQQRFLSAAPNTVWVGDLTAVATRAGWLYVAVLLDLYSRRVIGWAMSGKPDPHLALEAVAMALRQRRVRPGLIHHRDQGAQYSSLAYRRRLEQVGLIASMSRKGNCYDNAVAESFFSTLKHELVHDRTYQTREQASMEIFEFIEAFYNRQRLH